MVPNRGGNTPIMGNTGKYCEAFHNNGVCYHHLEPEGWGVLPYLGRSEINFFMYSLKEK